MTNDYVYISALNHYEYCPTRCYWIYVAGEFKDNEYTVEGDIIHENVHKTMKTTVETWCSFEECTYTQRNMVL